MSDTQLRQRTLLNQETDQYILTWIEAWLLDCRIRNLSPRTIEFYRQKIKAFAQYGEAQVIRNIPEITPNVIRRFLLYLEETDHNPGGIHAHYRCLRALLSFYEKELEPDDWHNPIKKVKPPKITAEPLPPVEIETVRLLAETCEARTFYGDRDRAILLCLLDSGARATEFLALDRSDMDLVTGAVFIRNGKGRKSRTVFLGQQSRKALRAYIKQRKDNHPGLWITDEGDRLSYSGLRHIIDRRAIRANVDTPQLHDFRRAFAIEMLRAGVDLISLQRLMGHSSLEVLQRYLKQLPEDLQAAHRLGSPVDRAGL